MGSPYPACGVGNYCPCENCKDLNFAKVLWRWEPDEFLTCGSCGRTLPAHVWEDAFVESQQKLD